MTLPYPPHGYGSQQQIVPPSLNDLNLPPNPFNVLAAMAVVRVDDACNRENRLDMAKGVQRENVDGCDSRYLTTNIEKNTQLFFELRSERISNEPVKKLFSAFTAN